MIADQAPCSCVKAVATHHRCLTRTTGALLAAFPGIQGYANSGPEHVEAFIAAELEPNLPLVCRDALPLLGATLLAGNRFLPRSATYRLVVDSLDSGSMSSRSH